MLAHCCMKDNHPLLFIHWEQQDAHICYLFWGVFHNASICINGLQNQLNALIVLCIQCRINDPANTQSREEMNNELLNYFV